ncbi:retrovirus-related pol polyprotein from transposon TNT 1-94, partial [Tanacetum coccineum]
MFDELLNSPSSVDHPAPKVIALIAEVVAPEPAVSTNSPSSTTVDQDAPSPSNSQTTPETQSPVISNDVEEENHDLDVAHMNNDPLFCIPILENNSEASSSDVIPTIVHTAAPNLEHITKWTKDHPLDNIIGEPERPAMQEELHEFERLEVWELVPRPNKVMVITLKWIYKTRSCLDISRVCCLYEYDRLPDGCKDGIFNGILREEVYVSQPGRFVDPANPNHVFSKGTVDPTLFISRKGKDILLMSIMDKISFFLGLQILQSPKGIFLNQSKYTLESLKKYGMESCNLVDTPMVKKSKLDEDTQGKAVDPIHYRGIFGTLMYLTSSRPNL